MNGAVRDCLIEEYETHIDALELPDPDDRHVPAAAIQGDCRFLVTSDTKDFPDSALQSHSVLAMGTDRFLTLIFDEDPDAFYASNVLDSATGARHDPLVPHGAYPDR